MNKIHLANQNQGFYVISLSRKFEHYSNFNQLMLGLQFILCIYY